MKKFACVLLFCWSSFYISAQTLDSSLIVREVDSLIQLNRTLLDSQQYDVALQLTQLAKSKALTALGKDHVSYAYSLFNHGRTFHRMGELQQVEALYLEAKEVFEKQPILEEPGFYLNCLDNLGFLYKSNNQYKKAEQSYLQATAAKAKYLGKEHVDYASGLNNLGILYKGMGQFEEAKKYFIEAKEIREKLLGKAHPDYAGILINLGIIEQNLGKYEEAQSLYLEAKHIFEEDLKDREHAFYLNCLNNLGGLYRDLGQYTKAEPYFLQVRDLREKKFGKAHPTYARSLESLGTLYFYAGQYKQAEPFMREAKALTEQYYGRDHVKFAGSLNNLGSLYESTGRADQAESFYLEAMEIWVRHLGKEHPYYARILGNLGNLYTDLSQYEQAERFHLAALKQKEKIWGKKHPIYVSRLIYLGNLYRRMGQYARAEQMILEAKNTLKEDLNMPEHQLYSACLNSFGNLYTDLHQYEQAEQYYLESIALKKKIQGKSNPDYAGQLMNLGILYEYMGQYSKAKPIYLEAKEIREEIIGRQHPDFAGTLINLGNVHERMQEFEKAESFYQEAIQILEEELDIKEHLFYLNGMEALGHLYFDQKKYEEAEHFYLKAKDLRKKVLGNEHPQSVLSLNHLQRTYTLSGQYRLASEHLQEIAPLRQSLLMKTARHTTEQELSTYTLQFVQSLNDLFSFVSLHPQIDTTLSSLCYDQALFHKGFLLQASNDLRKQANADSSLQETFHLWQSYHRRLAQAYSLPISERTDMSTLEEKANALEKELAMSINGFEQALRKISWREVKTALKPGEAAIEFVHYQFQEGEQKDSVMYAGILLRADTPEPTFIPLFKESELELAVLNQKIRPGERYVGRGIMPKKRKKHLNTPLNWAPLIRKLEGIQTIYFAPSGLLHRLNLASNPFAKTQTFSDHYHMIQLNSTRQLVIPHSEKLYPNKAVLFGGIDYEPEPKDLPIAHINLNTGANIDSFDKLPLALPERGMRGGSWTYLPWTEKEVKRIHEILNSSQVHTDLYTSHSASEEAFLQIGRESPSPRILHLATHGFFFPDLETEASKRKTLQAHAFKQSDHPMIRSGLVLAGANHVWQGNSPLPDREDGILTAYEISQMDLSHTELVVLSACETGLGDIQGNEGVYGLQRAFQMAGARYLIMSLWQVPDKETMEFMDLFYQFWLEKDNSIPGAFRATQNIMRKKHKVPSAWAAFVLVE